MMARERKGESLVAVSENPKDTDKDEDEDRGNELRTAGGRQSTLTRPLGLDFQVL